MAHGTGADTLTIGYGAYSAEVPRREYTAEQYARAQAAVEAIGAEVPEGATILADGRPVAPTDTIGGQVRTIELVQRVPDLG